ncbi:hypothetical protein [Streptacidiphilus fuscans]|uniref:Uncharacterized protein n=1 Tax=Streptacidiphilus fuscans TaxID=2789292 RepID=A0A931FBW2_9ACTN|nr:hypothetical protein [Streptacidiphilus fuscans]MBF9069092.1 hypothetical protein [Streptacidiphilus fuscans]
MGWPLRRRFLAWRMRRSSWDPDIIRALQLPVPQAVQERAQELIHEGKINTAIDEIRSSTGYDRPDARSVVLALMYSVPVPTGRAVPTRQGLTGTSH